MNQFLVHKISDNVGVALMDLAKGESVKGGMLSGTRVFELIITEPILMGHKMALRDIHEGEEVVRYGSPIGVAIHAITKGSHVHIHNVVSSRCRS